MSRARRLQAGAGLLVLVTLIGVVGFMIVEGLDVLVAIYQTVITISTVGFSEPTGGLGTGGRFLTIFLVVAGVGSAFYTASASIELGVEAFLGGERQRRRMDRQIASLSEHIILCGFGRVGEGVWERLRDEADAPPVVLVESDPDRVGAARELGIPLVEGDATRDEALLAAGIERAHTLIASVRSDSDNLAIVLSARARRPDLRIIARATEAESHRKLQLAGADRVVAPQLVGANRLAALAVEPELVEFIDLAFRDKMMEVRVEQFEVVAGAEVAGKALRESGIRRRSGALILAVEHPDGRTWLNPGPDFVVRAGHVVFGVGTADQIDRLRELASRPA